MVVVTITRGSITVVRGIMGDLRIGTRDDGQVIFHAADVHDLLSAIVESLRLDHDGSGSATKTVIEIDQLDTANLPRTDDETDRIKRESHT